MTGWAGVRLEVGSWSAAGAGSLQLRPAAAAATLAAAAGAADGPNDEGESFERPGKLSDKLPAPYMNEVRLGWRRAVWQRGRQAAWRQQLRALVPRNRQPLASRSRQPASPPHLPCPACPCPCPRSHLYRNVPQCTARAAGARALRQRRRLPSRPLPHHQGPPRWPELRLLAAAGLPRATRRHLGEMRCRAVQRGWEAAARGRRVWGRGGERGSGGCWEGWPESRAEGQRGGLGRAGPLAEPEARNAAAVS